MRRSLFRQVIERVASEPGVESIALASNVPFSSMAEGDDVRMAGAREGEEIDAETYVVTPDYFATMGLPLLRGRDFDASEAEPGAARRAVVVDEPLARRLRSDGDVLGRSLAWISTDQS